MAPQQWHSAQLVSHSLTQSIWSIRQSCNQLLFYALTLFPTTKQIFLGINKYWTPIKKQSL